jgi:hypothetical protein
MWNISVLSISAAFLLPTTGHAVELTKNTAFAPTPVTYARPTGRAQSVRRYGHGLTGHGQVIQ